jgi:glycerophosphoryl diester phosphodiesterase
MAIFIAILIIAALYVLAVQCRRGHKGMNALRGWNYAHRGLHGNGIPENSMAAFRAALEAGCGVELDLHLLKDGSLAVFHDGTLDRCTGKSGKPEDLTTADLENYPLEGTEETIPLFSQVLELFAGKAPIIVELKPVGSNHGALCQAACDLLDAYSGPYCLESFDPRCIYWLKKHRPDLIRGQLSEDFVHNPKNPLPMHMKFLLTHLLENFLTRPDFVAYRFQDRKALSPFLARKVWGAQGVTWTITRKEDLETAHKEGWLPIFEGFRP